MKISLSENALWKCLFFGLIAAYGAFYAPYGVNETDGGFLTGLAWQVLNGKVLYQDVIYVRPPLPVWLRALEISWLPDHFGVLGERWIFYIKVGLYSWLGASLLANGRRLWLLATFGFIVSAHCYPAMAWHTVDGILFAVLSLWLFFKAGGSVFTTILAGVSLTSALLCKQSFYPLLPAFAAGLWWYQWRRAWLFFAGTLLAGAAFVGYLVQFDLTDGFFRMTNGAASGGQALQHGLIDYFMITPELALPGLGLLAVGWGLYRKNSLSPWPAVFWWFWLFSLVGSYAVVTWHRQEHTAPFAQSRAMFWLATAVVAGLVWRKKAKNELKTDPQPLLAVLLLSVTWCATISWGYSLPMLFTTPWLWAAMVISGRLSRNHRIEKLLPFALLAALLLAFRVGYEFVYRDGKRSVMTAAMGAVFPKLTGICSTPESAALYTDLRALSERYGPNITVLPAFPQAAYLTGAPPPLPLDWVVNRETNGDNALIFKAMESKRPVLLFQKEYIDKLQHDPELAVARALFEKTTFVEETSFFMVKKL